MKHEKLFNVGDIVEVIEGGYESDFGIRIPSRVRGKGVVTKATSINVYITMLDDGSVFHYQPYVFYSGMTYARKIDD